MKDLTKGNSYKTFILFAIPMVLASLLSQAYSTINVIMAGKLLGDNALAATGATSPFNSFVNSAFWGYGMGVGIYVSHLFGARDYCRIKETVICNFFFLTSVLIGLSILFVVFRYEIYAFLNVDPRIIPDCNRYFVIATVGKVFILFAANCVYVFNAIGDSALPMYVSSLSAILNIGVGAAAILLFGTGVEGLAIGTVVGAMVSSVIYIVKFASVFRKMGVQEDKTPFRFQIVRETFKYALPTMTQQSIMFFAGMILSPMINNIGGAASASYTVTLRIFDINQAIYVSSSKSVGNYTAQCYGAKKYHLLKKGVKVGLIQALVLVVPVILACCLFAKPVTSLFYRADADPLSVKYTMEFLRYCLPLLCINVFANMFHNFFRGVGRMKALLIMTFAGSAARILVTSLLIGPFGIYGYYAGWVMAWIFDAAVGAGLYFFGSWRKDILTKKEDVQ